MTHQIPVRSRDVKSAFHLERMAIGGVLIADMTNTALAEAAAIHRKPNHRVACVAELLGRLSGKRAQFNFLRTLIEQLEAPCAPSPTS